MDHLSSLAARLLELRRRHGWTQERLADEAGVTSRTVQRVEAGEPPGLTTIESLAGALGIDTEDLMLLRDGLQPPPEVAPPRPAALDGLRVVVADDEYWDRRAIQRAWDRAGGPGKLELLSSGKELVALLEGARPQDLPALVLLDLNMPQPDGFEVLRWMRGKDYLSRVPAVVLTGTDDAAEIARGYAAGANAVVTKPSSFRDLCAVMTRTIDFWLATVQRSEESTSPPRSR
jgi:CheY-like chemotaxis protein/DNA-binding XRE family transcriptional regulator